MGNCYGKLTTTRDNSKGWKRKSNRLYQHVNDDISEFSMLLIIIQFNDFSDSSINSSVWSGLSISRWTQYGDRDSEDECDRNESIDYDLFAIDNRQDNDDDQESDHTRTLRSFIHDNPF